MEKADALVLCSNEWIPWHRVTKKRAQFSTKKKERILLIDKVNGWALSLFSLSKLFIFLSKRVKGKLLLSLYRIQSTILKGDIHSTENSNLGQIIAWPKFVL